ncbi:MAG: orotidine-5'-phosphate decarboxylase [Bdellovibrionaceae bacterium]|nr:orotidine-5'-phosphate decarboxylase [Pseudobdellovibrionaceae bacterium]
MKKLPIFIALDLETDSQALVCVKKTQNYVQTYKIGPRLFLKYGKKLIEDIKKVSPSVQIFLDFKFYDIPSSTLSAVRSAFEIGANFVTVHANVGQETLNLLYQLETKLSKLRNFKILFVTVLSSQSSSPETEQKVFSLAESVYSSGLKGIVCSAWEVKALREKYSDSFLVTPGIRLKGDSKEDQKRVMTPLEALQAGSSALVIGRSLIKHPEPTAILEELSQVLVK